MKILLCLISFVSLCFMTDAQNIYVLKVKGNVYADGELIKIKDKLSDKSNLTFSSADAMAHVYYPGKGYYILSGQKNKSAKNEFVVSLKEAMVPPSQYYKTSTRAISYEEFVMDDIYDLKAFFRGNLLAIDELTVPLRPHAFLVNDGNYFFLKIEDREIRLENSVYEITLTKELVGNGQDLSLYYKTYGVTKPIGNFTIQFISSEELTEELSAFKDNFSDLHYEQFESDALSYVQNAFGKTNPDTFSSLLEKGFKVNN